MKVNCAFFLINSGSKLAPICFIKGNAHITTK